MNWKAFTEGPKAVAVYFALTASAFAWMYTHFETVSAAEQKWNNHSQQLICRTVAQTRIRIAKLESYLKHAKPPPQEKAQADDEIEALKKEIDILDPKRVCG
jgi:hypothetical protein